MLLNKCVTYEIMEGKPFAMQPTLCALCKRIVRRDFTTAGLLYQDGAQAYACLAHAQDMRKWLSGWARFAAAHRHIGALKKEAYAHE